MQVGIFALSSHSLPLCLSVSRSLLLIRTPATLDWGPLTSVTFKILSPSMGMQWGTSFQHMNWGRVRKSAGLLVAPSPDLSTSCHSQWGHHAPLRLRQRQEHLASLKPGLGSACPLLPLEGCRITTSGPHRTGRGGSGKVSFGMVSS